MSTQGQLLPRQPTHLALELDRYSPGTSSKPSLPVNALPTILLWAEFPACKKMARQLRHLGWQWRSRAIPPSRQPTALKAAWTLGPSRSRLTLKFQAARPSTRVWSKSLQRSASSCLRRSPPLPLHHSNPFTYLLLVRPVASHFQPLLSASQTVVKVAASSSQAAQLCLVALPGIRPGSMCLAVPQGARIP